MPRLSCFVLLLLVLGAAAAEAVPYRDPQNGVFTASHIVIVKRGEESGFCVVRNLRGNRHVGSQIELPGLRLLSHRSWQQPQSNPITADTRILLFLQPDETDPNGLKITDYGHAYFFRDVEKVDELETQAKAAIALHKKWKVARDQPDRQDRVESLYPFLLDSPHMCHELTLAEMVKLSPDSGDYVAAQLPTETAHHCGRLMLDLRLLRSPKAHAAIIVEIDRAIARFRVHLNGRGLEKLNALTDWSEFNKGIDGDYGLILDGLGALNWYHDRADLPYMRGLVSFLSANNFHPVLEPCLAKMAEFPAPENVPVLISAWEDHKAWQMPPEQTDLPSRLAGAMRKQQDLSLAAPLIEMLAIPRCHDAARDALHELTGQELQTADEWRAWQAEQAKPDAKPQ